MKRRVVRSIIRTKLTLQSVNRATADLLKWRDKYISLADGLSEEQGCRSVMVPEMIGVDPEMRGWSYYQLLEHNAIVNKAMSLNVRSLMTGKGRRIIEKFNPKTDVLPQESVGVEQVEAFSHSVDEHISLIKEFTHLKGSETSQHPIFGEFNAHMWHGMAGVHLGVHYKQARMIVKEAKSSLS